MARFFKILSYLFHPILTPIAGTLCYYAVTPRFSPLEAQAAHVLPIFILTVIIPIITFFILKNLGLVSSIFMETAKERRFPLLIQLIILALVLFKVLPNNYIPELYFFFAGLAGATAACLLLALLNYKVSLHLVGTSALLMYLIALSIYFEKNLIIAICVFTLVMGSVASARLFLKTNTITSLLIGLNIGFLCQLLTIKFWF